MERAAGGTHDARIQPSDTAGPGWHCRATSRWTLFTCPWSGGELLVTKRQTGRDLHLCSSTRTTEALQRSMEFSLRNSPMPVDSQRTAIGLQSHSLGRLRYGGFCSSWNSSGQRLGHCVFEQAVDRGCAVCNVTLVLLRGQQSADCVSIVSVTYDVS